MQKFVLFARAVVQQSEISLAAAGELCDKFQTAHPDQRCPQALCAKKLVAKLDSIVVTDDAKQQEGRPETDGDPETDTDVEMLPAPAPDAKPSLPTGVLPTVVAQPAPVVIAPPPSSNPPMDIAPSGPTEVSMSEAAPQPLAETEKKLRQEPEASSEVGGKQEKPAPDPPSGGGGGGGQTHPLPPPVDEPVPEATTATAASKTPGRPDGPLGRTLADILGSTSHAAPGARVQDILQPRPPTELCAPAVHPETNILGAGVMVAPSVRRDTNVSLFMRDGRLRFGMFNNAADHQQQQQQVWLHIFELGTGNPGFYNRLTKKLVRIQPAD